jgi:hypothetical protein
MAPQVRAASVVRPDRAVWHRDRRQRTVYPSGQTTLAWCCGDVLSISVYDSPEQVERIHGHGGYTDLVWLDPEPRTGHGEPGRANVGHSVVSDRHREIDRDGRGQVGARPSVVRSEQSPSGQDGRGMTATTHPEGPRLHARQA